MIVENGRTCTKRKHSYNINIRLNKHSRRKRTLQNEKRYHSQPGYNIFMPSNISTKETLGFLGANEPKYNTENKDNFRNIICIYLIDVYIEISTLQRIHILPIVILDCVFGYK